jgi:hypothetical protein
MRTAIATVLAFCAYASPASAQAADAEKQLRCTVPVDAAVYARQAGAVPAISRGKVTVTRAGQSAPSLMVEGWNPAPGPLAKVLGELGHEAGFAVTGAEGLGNVSLGIPRASLTQVLDHLTSQVGASWSFSSGVVHVLKTPQVSVGSATMPLPANRDVTLALLDTLRGYDATNVSLGESGISFAGSPAALGRIQSGLAGVSEVFAFDVSFMQGRPTVGRYNWAAAPGSTATADGAGGRLILSEEGAAAFPAFLSSMGDVRTGGIQTVAGPSGWALVVPQSQCGQGTAEIQLKPKRMGDGFSMQVGGLGAPFEVPMVALGQTLVIAARDPVGGWINIVTIRPRVLAVK